MADPAFIQDVPTRDQYIAAAGQTIFDYTFPIFDEVDIIVEKTPFVTGIPLTLVLNVDYTVTGVGVQSGGTIVLAVGAATSDVIIIFREVVKKRITDFSNTAAFNSANINLELDRIVQMTQDRFREISQSLRFPDSDVTSPALDLPGEVARAGNVLAFDPINSQPIVGVNNSLLQTLITTSLTSLVPDPSVVVASFVSARAIDGNLLVGGEVVLITDIDRGDHFVVRPLTTQVDNDGTILELTTPNGFYLERLNPSGIVNILWFGVKKDGSADIGPAYQNAINLVTVTRETLLFPAGNYLQTTPVVKDNFDGLTIIGWGAIIDFQVSGSLTLGDHSVDGNDFSTQLTPTIKNVVIIGLHFVSSAPGYNETTNRNAFASPLNLSSFKGCRVIHCHFEDWDFAAVNIEAASKNCRVLYCTFKQNNESNVAYGVRPFNFVVPLDNYNETTGLLLFPAPTTSFHEDIIVFGCEFDGCSHGILSWNVHNSKYIYNTFRNPQVRTISASNFNFDCLIMGNTHFVEDNVESILSTCIAIGVGSERVRIEKETFKGTVSGIAPNSSLKVIQCSGVNRNIVIDDCEFDVVNADIDIVLDANVEATINGSRFLTDIAGTSISPILINNNPASSPGFDQPKVVITNNIDKANPRFVTLNGDPAGTPEHIIIENNDLRVPLVNSLVATNTTGIWKVKARNNEFVAGAADYVVDFGTGKALFAYADSFERDVKFTTGGGVGSGISTPVTATIEAPPEIFDLPGYLYSAWGGGENAQPIDEFEFEPTTLSSTTIAGNINRDAATASFQVGHALVKVTYTPTHGI